MSDSSIHICRSTYDGHEEAELVIPPAKSRSGACVVRSVQIYLTAGKGGHLVQGAPSADWNAFHVHQDWEHPLTDVQAAAGLCPPQGDLNYVHVFDVPDGTFLELLKLWRQLVSSPERFDRNLALVPPSESKGTLFARLKTVLTDRALLAKVHLSTVALDPSGTGRDVHEPRPAIPGIPVFSLGFEDPSSRNLAYHLAVVWIDGRFRVIGVAIWQA
jgi:hypothetical protein